MAWWAWALDVCGTLLLAFLLYGVALLIRRRVIARHGGTFELSHRKRGAASGGGWVLGLGRYSGEHLEWFRIFSLSPRPKVTWSREELSYDGTRHPMGAEQTSLYPDHLVIDAVSGDGQIELAMSAGSLTGFQAWLEAKPPGTDWNR